MRRLLPLTTITIIAMLITACGGDSSTGPDPGNNGGENNGEGQAATYSVDMTPSPSEGGSVSASADGPFEEGETVELTAEASDEYVFAGWTGDLGNSDNPLSLTMDQDYSLTANFEKRSYALTTNTDGEGVIAEEIIQQKTTDYEHGTTVELTAAPSGDWKFVEWTGDLTGTNNPTQVTVDTPKEVTAVFEKRSYPLTILTDGQGGVSETVIQQKTTDYEQGTVVELAPSAATGWEFAGWQEDVTGSQSPVQITITEPTTVVADFELLGAGSRPDFYLANNGVTIKCEEASVGDIGTVSGVTYIKRSAGDITTTNAATTCTSGITDMSDLFNGASNFNGDISHWDVSSVTDMRKMFYGADAFNQDIGSWDVSSVIYMRRIFQYASSFNQDIGDWDVSSVESMYAMFHGAFSGGSSFNGDISDWDVSSVEDMGRMFYRASSFNQNISNWDVSSATDMGAMFYEATSFNQGIGSWGDNVSSVEDMGGMFNGATSFNQDVSNWDVSTVTDMENMFYDASSFDQNISSWCVSSFSSPPTGFDTNAGFEGNSSLQPQWGTCPSN